MSSDDCLGWAHDNGQELMRIQLNFRVNSVSEESHFHLTEFTSTYFSREIYGGHD